MPVALATLLLPLPLIFIFIIIRRTQTSRTPQVTKMSEDLTSSSPAMIKISQSLAEALPDSVILPHDAAAFKQAMNFYWAQQECEVIPACIVRPRNVQELCTVVSMVKREYNQRKQAGTEQDEGLFAIRGGGHSASGAASIKGGVVIDLSLFREVTTSEDGSSVRIGGGARWTDVYKALDKRGLAVVGSRNSAVGVAGYTLGGGISFYSPRFGLACSNILAYEVVLANGSVTTASASTNPDLWRALKGGSNNFGIVTSFTYRSFPATKLWSGALYLPGFQASKVLADFHECVKISHSDDPSIADAAGPLASFTYVHSLGIQVIHVHIAHTNPLQNEKTWPTFWRNSSLASRWRLWSTCKVQTIGTATDELTALNPPGKRQTFATTTIKNDPATLAAAHSAHRDAIALIRGRKIKGLIWTLVLQPFLPSWVRKGDAIPLGLDDDTDEPLVNLEFTVNWEQASDDEFIKTTTRRAIEQIDAVAAANQTSHRYQYLNYCAEWQKPLESYGEEDWRFLQGVSRKYDPEGLFQRGCVGGFKLDVGDGEHGS